MPRCLHVWKAYFWCYELLSKKVFFWQIVGGEWAWCLKGLASVLYGVVDVFPCCLAAIAMVYKKDDFAVVWSGIHCQNSPQRLAKNRLEIMSRTNSSPEQCSSGFFDQPEKFPLFFPKSVQNLCTQLQVLRKLWSDPDSGFFYIKKNQIGGYPYIPL